MKMYSNEIVFRGHPDKVCDQIAGAILDQCIAYDPCTRAGIEVTGGKGKIFVTGEICTTAKINVKRIVKDVLRTVGYSTKYKVINNLGIQSSDIAQGVNAGGAGDQGMMFGYACYDTPELLPTAQVMLQKFAEWYDGKVHSEPFFFLPDGKAQITGIYDDDFELKEIDTFLVSYQNYENERETTDYIIKNAIYRLCKSFNVKVNKILINPTGRFRIGGFEGDAGVCGRKIVVDAYQGFANVGGGNMNGKDPSKVDMSAAYKARQLACKLLKKKDLKWCEVQLSYAIGEKQPLAIYIDSDRGNLPVPGDWYKECEPCNIIEELKLHRPIYERQAMFGHFFKDNSKGF